MTAIYDCHGYKVMVRPVDDGMTDQVDVYHTDRAGPSLFQTTSLRLAFRWIDERDFEGLAYGR